MRFNSNSVLRLSQETPDWEGKLCYIPPEKSSQSSVRNREIIKSKARSAAKLVVASSNSSSKVNTAGERWFRIKANLLFYFRLTPEGCKPTLPGTEPLGVLVLEHFHVQKEGFEKSQADALGKNQFSIIFANEPDKRHFFIAENQQRALQWETALKQASYQRLRENLIDLQIKLRLRTGEDPLEGSSLLNNPLFSSKSSTCSKSNTTDTPTNSTYEASFLEPPKTMSMPARIAPPPPPRHKKSKPFSKNKTFQSHIVNDWESISAIAVGNEATEKSFMEPVNDRAASFRSHIPTDAPVDNLIQF